MTDNRSNRRDPADLSDRELLKRIARKDRSKYDLPEIAENTLDYMDDGK